MRHDEHGHEAVGQREETLEGVGNDRPVVEGEDGFSLAHAGAEPCGWDDESGVWGQGPSFPKMILPEVF